MRSFKLKIAGYNIGFEASAGGPDLKVAHRFLRNLDYDSNIDVHIKIHSGTFQLPANAERVFHAPFVEEKDGIVIQNNPDFWSVWKADSTLYIKTIFPLSDTSKEAVLKFSLDNMEWDLWIETDNAITDPFEFPLDGLILYYLTAINNDIMIHASGVSYAGKGFLFSGVSGKGKSTLSGLWESYGAKVIHDDRLILRKTRVGYMMFNTPVYDNDAPADYQLNRIFIIEHGSENRLIQVKESAAVSQVMANCIQHTWDPIIISRLLQSISEMCKIIPIFRLSFKPEISVIDHILEEDGYSE
jgi:hypothetical protein